MAALRATQPLYTPLSLETAALANYSFIVKIVGDIIQAIKEVRSFRSECSNLANTCIFMSLAFLENRVELQDVRSGKEFIACLRETFLLVTQCTDKWSILHIGWDWAIEEKVKSLKERLEACQKTFDTEILINVKTTSSEAVTNLRSLQSNLMALKDSVDNHTSQRREFLNHFHELDRALEARRQEERSFGSSNASSVKIIQMPDPRIFVQSRIRDNSAPKNGTFEGNPVVFEQVQTIPNHLPSLVKIYRQIGGIARVQKLFDIVEENQVQYAMLQDVENHHQSIDQAIQSRALEGFPMMQKLKFAYELVATMSALHSSNLLIKVLSDTTVFIDQTSDGEIRPLLTNLKSARDIWEVTAHQEYDLRYESPEVKAARMRSRVSDVWSLGIVLWQCFLSSYPYGLRSTDITDIPANNNRRKELTQWIQGKNPPFETIIDIRSKLGKISDTLIPLIQRCLSPNPDSRPAASSLAQNMFDLLILESTKEVLGDDFPKEQLEPYLAVDQAPALSVEQLIEAARCKKAARKQPNNKAGSSSKEQVISKVSKGKVEKLLQSSGEAGVLYAVGTAYLWGVVELEEEDREVDSISKPIEILCAERALPYLQSAQRQGYKDAAEGLFYAHRTFAAYYRDLMDRNDE